MRIRCLLPMAIQTTTGDYTDHSGTRKTVIKSFYLFLFSELTSSTFRKRKPKLSFPEILKGFVFLERIQTSCCYLYYILLCLIPLRLIFIVIVNIAIVISIIIIDISLLFLFLCFFLEGRWFKIKYDFFRSLVQNEIREKEETEQ